MWSELQRQRFGVRARLISTEVSAVKAVSAAATAVPPAASRPLRLPMYKSVYLIVCVCVCVNVCLCVSVCASACCFTFLQCVTSLNEGSRRRAMSTPCETRPSTCRSDLGTLRGIGTPVPPAGLPSHLINTARREHSRRRRGGVMRAGC